MYNSFEAVIPLIPGQEKTNHYASQLSVFEVIYMRNPHKRPNGMERNEEKADEKEYAHNKLNAF